MKYPRHWTCCFWVCDLFPWMSVFSVLVFTPVGNGSAADQLLDNSAGAGQIGAVGCRGEIPRLQRKISGNARCKI